MDHKIITNRLIVSSTDKRGATLDCHVNLETNEVTFAVDARVGHWTCPTSYEAHAFDTYAEARAFFDNFTKGAVA